MRLSGFRWAYFVVMTDGDELLLQSTISGNIYLFLLIN